MLRHLLITALTLGLGACTDNAKPRDKTGIGANGRRDLIGSDLDISGEKQGKSYSAYDEHRDRKGTGLAFAGYGCESNCADVMSGYQRAHREKVIDPRLCAASTWGDLEGCVAFAQGQPSEISSLPPLKEVVAR